MGGEARLTEKKPDAARSSKHAPTKGSPSPALTLAPPSALSVQAIAALQSAAGNAAVSALLDVQRQAVVQPRTTTTGSQPLVKRGSRGPVVEELQTKLNLIPTAAPDAFLKVDGDFAANTETAVNAFQKNVMGIAVPDGKVGKNTWPAIDQAVSAAESAPHAHPVLHLNDSSAAVGEAQEKLNAAAGAPLLSVASGVVDAATWTRLDNAAPGGGTRASRGGSGIEEHVGAAGGGNPLAAAIGSTHPIVGPGNLLKGIAVKEMQQKLNGFLIAKGKAFMKWQETVGGHTYGLTSVFSWTLTPTAITVTVGFNFVPPTALAPMPPAPLGTWMSFIKSTWNQFKAVDTADPKKSVDIVFNPIQSTDPSARTVKVMPGKGRSDAGQFFVVDPDIAGTVSHEFGHMIGLKDEYQQTAADFRASTGYEAPVGQTTGPTSNLTPAQVAQRLQNAIVGRAAPSVTPSPASQVIAGMGQGAFAQRVIAAYKALPSVAVGAVAHVPAVAPNFGVQASAAFNTTGDLVKDLDTGLTNFDLGSIPGGKYRVIEVLSYDSGSRMGDPQRQVDQHEHGAEPRHVREFSQLVAHTRGGVWQPRQR